MASGVEARRVAYSLASSQLGVLARRQLMPAGLTGNLVDDWLRSGYLLKVVKGVYTLGRPAEEAASLWMAGVLFGGNGAVLAGSSAAAAWGLCEAPKQVEVMRSCGLPTTVIGTAPHDAWIICLRRGPVRPAEVTNIGPLPVMKPARLLLDLAGRVNRFELRRTFIEAGREGLLTPECLDLIQIRGRDFTGGRMLRALAGHWTPSTGKIRSVLEGEFKLMCSEQGVPPALTNKTIGRYEVDCLWPEAMLVVELDGRKFHGDVVALESDSEKSRHLRSMGYKVLRFSWNDVVQRPEWVAAQIQEGLRSINPALSGVN